MRQLLYVGFLVCFFAILPDAHAAFDIPPNDGYVTDAAGILTPAEEQAIESLLQSEAERTTNEIAVVIVPTLHGEPIESVGLDIGRRWGIGSSKDNGILLLIAYDDREMRIDVGYGLEGMVPDIVAKGIIETDLVPAFREGNFAGGITAAIESLQKHTVGEYTATRYESKQESSGVMPAVFFILFFFSQWLIAILARTSSWWLGGVWGAVVGIIMAVAFGFWLAIPVTTAVGLFLDFVVSRAYQRRGKTAWWAGGGWGPGGSGHGGGGFGGFGGGSFGGGGASGRW